MRPVKSRVRNIKIIILKGVYDVPDGVEGGESLLDGVRGTGDLTVGISDAHGV